MLRFREIVAGYGKARVLFGVTASVKPGTITALVGANGAGKTTLMRALIGLLPITGGQIELGGEQIESLRPNQRIDRGLALVPEGRLVFPNLTVVENLRLGSIVRRARHDHTKRISEMFAMFPRLAERSRQLAGTLSGGEQQMLAIARGLMSKPDVLLLDEPTLGLAPAMCEVVFQTIANLKEEGLAILLTEQNVPRALELATTAHVLENGRVALSGSGPELKTDSRVGAAFFGRMDESETRGSDAGCQ
jgi:branched-chain amino acid transport system ATP-binding protein